MYNDVTYTLIFDNGESTLTINNEDGWDIYEDEPWIVHLPKGTLEKHIGKKAWWFRNSFIKSNFKFVSVENV